MEYSNWKEQIGPLRTLDMTREQKNRILVNIKNHTWESESEQRSALTLSRTAKRGSRAVPGWGAAIAAVVVAGVGIGVVLDHDPTISRLRSADISSQQISWLQVPANIQLTVDAIKDSGVSSTPSATIATTKDGRHVYHIVLDGQFGTNKQIAKFTLAVPSDDKTVEKLSAYGSNGKLLWSKSSLPVVTGDWSFSGLSKDWKATSSVKTSAVLMSRKPDLYYQAYQVGYKLRYTGATPAAIKTLSYNLNLRNYGSSAQQMPFPSSGVIASQGQGGSHGGLISYKDVTGTLDLQWGKHHEQLKLASSHQ